MANSFNVLLDSGCTRHVVRDLALFHDYAAKSTGISVGTATCGSLVALGSGDVEFRYPFGDRCVTFTLRDCLYAPTAPMNLLSVGTLVERGMSCLFSPGGVTKVFFPDDHPKFPGLTFSATVANRLSFLLLDFIPPATGSVPVVSSVPVAFPARVSPLVSPPVAVPPSHSVFLPSSSSSSHRKPNSPPKNSKKPPFSNPNCLVVDTTLPSHIFNDRSLFTTYLPSRQIHRNVFGTNIVIEGTGDVHIRVVVSGKSILFRFRDSWHVPSSPHHFFSCSTVVSLGHQVIIAGRSPRMIFSHKHRLVVPGLPKYIPFTRLGALTVLKFEIPSPESISYQPLLVTDTQTAAHDTISLHASTYHPFAGLAATLSAFDRCPPTQTHQRHEFPFSSNCPSPDAIVTAVDVNRCAKDMSNANDGLHGGEDELMTPPPDVMTDILNGDEKIQAANTSGDDPNIRLKANSLEILTAASSPAVFNPQVGDNFIVHLPTPSCLILSQSFTSISNVNMTPSPYFLLSSFSIKFSPLTLFESSFHTSVQRFFMLFSLQSLSSLNSLYLDIDLEETGSIIFHTSIFL
jgi:hypothetical protein